MDDGLASEAWLLVHGTSETRRDSPTRTTEMGGVAEQESAPIPMESKVYQLRVAAVFREG